MEFKIEDSKMPLRYLRKLHFQPDFFLAEIMAISQCQQRLKLKRISIVYFVGVSVLTCAVSFLILSMNTLLQKRDNFMIYNRVACQPVFSGYMTRPSQGPKLGQM